MKKQVISIVLSSCLLLNGTKVKSEPITLTIATCAALCKIVGTAIVIAGTTYIHTKIYKHKKTNKLYRLESPKKQTLIEVSYNNIGTIKADNLQDARKECQKLAEQRGVRLMIVIGHRGGRFKCMASW